MCWFVEYINSVWPIAKLNKFELLILRTGKFSLNELYNFQDELDPALFAAVFNLEEEKFKRSLYETKAKAALQFADKGEIEKAKEELTTSVDIIATILFKCDMRKTFKIISQAFAKIGDVEFPLIFSNKITYIHNKWFFIAISKEFALLGDFKNAIKIVDTLEDVFYKSEAFKNISNAYAIKGNFESANEIASKIKIEEYKSKAYAFIAKEYFKLGDIKKANGILKSAISIAKGIDENKNSEQVGEALLYISKIAVSIGENELANELLETSFKVTKRNIRRTGIIYSDGFYPEIAEMFANAGYIQSAINTTEEILTLEKDRLETYSKIIFALLKRGDGIEAKEVFRSVIISNGNTIECKGSNVEDYDRSKAFSEIAELFVDNGDNEKAKETVNHALSIVNQMGDDYIKNYNQYRDVVPQIASVVARIGSFNFVLKITDNFEDSFFKSMLFRSLSIAFADIGYFNTAFESANYITDTDGYTKEYVLSEITKAQKKIADSEVLSSLPEKKELVIEDQISDKTRTSIKDFEIALKTFTSFSKVVKTIETNEEFSYFNKYLLDSNLSIFSVTNLEEILTPWRNNLLKKSETPLKYLRHSFLYSSSSISIYNSIIAMIKANIGSKNESAWFSIIRQCPQLGLDFLLFYS